LPDEARDPSEESRISEGVSGREAKPETKKLIRRKCYLRERERRETKREREKGEVLTIITVTFQLQRGLPNCVEQTATGLCRGSAMCLTAGVGDHR